MDASWSGVIPCPYPVFPGDWPEVVPVEVNPALAYAAAVDIALLRFVWATCKAKAGLLLKMALEAFAAVLLWVMKFCPVAV
jgi:hypothetical protein